MVTGSLWCRLGRVPYDAESSEYCGVVTVDKDKTLMKGDFFQPKDKDSFEPTGSEETCSQSELCSSNIRTQCFLSRPFTTVCAIHLHTDTKHLVLMSRGLCTDRGSHGDSVSHSYVWGSEVRVHGWCLLGSMVLCVSSYRLPVIQGYRRSRRNTCSPQQNPLTGTQKTWLQTKP